MRSWVWLLYLQLRGNVLTILTVQRPLMWLLNSTTYANTTLVDTQVVVVMKMRWGTLLKREKMVRWCDISEVTYREDGNKNASSTKHSVANGVSPFGRVLDGLIVAVKPTAVGLNSTSLYDEERQAGYVGKQWGRERRNKKEWECRREREREREVNHRLHGRVPSAQYRPVREHYDHAYLTISSF